MIREVDLVSYLPEFMQSYNEPVEALKAENPEFAIMWKAVDQIFYNRFIATADEYGISRFEKILGIYPMEEDSIEIRRKRVQNRWFNKVPHTLRSLVAKLKEYLRKDNFDIYMDNDSYFMRLIVYSSDESSVEEVNYLLDIMLPANILTEVIYEIVTETAVIRFGAIVEQADIIELKQRGS